jgi:hypothetical protein
MIYGLVGVLVFLLLIRFLLSGSNVSEFSQVSESQEVDGLGDRDGFHRQMWKAAAQSLKPPGVR